MKKNSVIATGVYKPVVGAHAVRVGDAVYVGATLPLDKDGVLVGAGNTAVQIEQVFKNLDAILRSAGAEWEDVFKVNMYFGLSPDWDQLRSAYAVKNKYLKAGQQVGVVASMGFARPDILVTVELFAHTSDQKQIFSVPDGKATESWADAMRVGDRFFVSGQLPIRRDDRSAFSNAGEAVAIKYGLGAQSEQVYDNLDEILRVAGVDWSDVVKVRQYITRPKVEFDDIRDARNRYMKLGKFTSTSVGCYEPHPEWRIKDWHIQVELEASIARKEYVNVPGRPQNPDGPQPHVIKAGKTMHIHGMVPWDDDLTTLHDGDIRGQTQVVYGHLDAMLKGAGLNWSNVVHARTFCVNADHFAVARQVQNRWLAETPFANTELVASMYAHDGKALLEVEIMAISG